jgi:hypothetical protein
MENSQLTIADMASLKQLIEAACNRGAFRAPEMRSVGEIYDKLTRFLAAAQQQAQATQSQGDQNA